MAALIYSFSLTSTKWTGTLSAACRELEAIDCQVVRWAALLRDGICRPGANTLPMGHVVLPPYKMAIFLPFWRDEPLYDDFFAVIA